MTEKGIIYVATGDKYVREAEISALSAKRIMPDIPIALFTHSVEYSNPVFDLVYRVEKYRNNFSDKIDPLLSTPFRKSIFIDSDTFICEDISDIFNLLDSFDLAVAHAYDRRPVKVPVPDCFCELNTGVIAFVNSPAMNEFLKRWRIIYDEYFHSEARVIGDQASFRKVLHDSQLRFYILPPEYNMRPQFRAIAGRCEGMKILHMRGINHEQWRQKINGKLPLKIRVTIPSWDDLLEDRLIVVHDSKIQHIIVGLLKMVRFVAKLAGKRK